MDPITIGVAVAGAKATFALARKSIELCSSALETADDISGIAKHLDAVFHAHGQVAAAVEKKEKEKPLTPLQKLFKKKQAAEASDSEELSDIITMTIEKKKLDRQIWRLALEIDARHGEGTWKSCLDTRKARIKARQNAEEVARQNALKKAKSDKLFWHKVAVEVGKVIILCAVAAAVGAFLYWASTANISQLR